MFLVLARKFVCLFQDRFRLEVIFGTFEGLRKDRGAPGSKGRLLAIVRSNSEDCNEC
jgi:hypothetical protein